MVSPPVRIGGVPIPSPDIPGATRMLEAALAELMDLASQTTPFPPRTAFVGVMWKIRNAMMLLNPGSRRSDVSSKQPPPATG
jgi:hypothetical protein